ncbi:response regulator transcription factor [Coralloluteibacterium stylophorae]|uniref:Response regulator n=1 Tax=Coralloluteibacterium stylophorae TaxID=1776034 RepID=A0A8J7VT63_9GAMM|nr:response regulator [Coralloluteibacterium stylophorae]MBS7456962.1 response regulator [Coralloluteibacterium stylophorae]
MRILVVDDDVELAALLQFALAGAGYEVVTAFDGDAALACFERHRPDLVVLDVNLPGRDGFEVLEALRRDSDVPVMMLTVRAAEEDEVRGLDLGADDYLRKPFSPRALRARVRALLRRAAEDAADPVLRAGDLVVDGSRSEMHLGDGERARLSTLELRLLRLLLGHGGRPVDPERVIGFVWSDRAAADRDALKQLVHRLRRKLVRIGGAGEWIEYVANAGYAFSRPEP